MWAEFHGNAFGLTACSWRTLWSEIAWQCLSLTMDGTSANQTFLLIFQCALQNPTASYKNGRACLPGDGSETKHWIWALSWTSAGYLCMCISGARLEGRMTTHASKKGSERLGVSDSEKGFPEGSQKRS